MNCLEVLLASTRLVASRLAPSPDIPMIGMRSPGSSVARPQAMWLPGNRKAATIVPETIMVPAIKVLRLRGLLKAAATTMVATVSKRDMLPREPPLVLLLVLPRGNSKPLLVDNLATDTVLTEVVMPILPVWLRRRLQGCLLCMVVLPALRHLLPQAISLPLLHPAISPHHRLLRHKWYWNYPRKSHRKCVCFLLSISDTDGVGWP